MADLLPVSLRSRVGGIGRASVFSRRKPTGRSARGPRISACTSCVPSYVFTASRFITWRMTWYSSDDAVAAVHVARHAGDVQRLAAVVALQQADHLGRGVVLVHQPPEAQHRLQAQRDLGLHVRQLLLDQLRRRQRPAEHHALQCVVARRMPAELRRAQRVPRQCRSARCSGRKTARAAPSRSAASSRPGRTRPAS